MTVTHEELVITARVLRLLNASVITRMQAEQGADFDRDPAGPLDPDRPAAPTHA